MANQVLYGFHRLADVFSERINNVGIPVINTAIDATLAEHNRQLNAFMNLFVDRTTDYKRRYKSPVAARLQPLEEAGRARPIQRAGYYDIAFPMHRAGAAWGWTYEARIKATVADTNELMSTMLTADARWLRDHIFAALFLADGWTYTDEQWGALTVEGLANGDSVNYLIQAGQDAGTTDTHLLAQAGAIADNADPFSTMKTELLEHPENSGEVVAMIPTGLKATTKALTSFIPLPDMNIDPGSAAMRLVGNLGATVPGEVIGYHDDGVWIVEWPSMPANYIIATTTGGDRALCMREEPEAQLQGFNRVADRDDHPFYEAQYMRKCGFGGQNRVNALVTRIGNGSYAVPTGYDSPMP